MKFTVAFGPSALNRTGNAPPTPDTLSVDSSENPVGIYGSDIGALACISVTSRMELTESTCDVDYQCKVSLEESSVTFWGFP